jgi:peptidoglycan/xylan/chitin deacetylase (PgdA/CDA1 family)
MNSYTRKKIISLVAPVLSRLKVHKLFAPAYSGLGHILTFHRVIPLTQEERIHNHLSLEISPEQLESTIQFYKKEGYGFVSLDQVYQYLKEGKTNKKFVAFTFDDGYKDNFTIAFPILKKHGIPFTIYITTNFPDYKAILWWYLLEETIKNKEAFQFTWQGVPYTYDCPTVITKELVFDQLRTLINQSFDKASHLNLLTAIFNKSEDQLYAYSKSLVMSWAEIKTLSEDPLCTIGAHTVNHYPLSRIGDKELIFEIQHSKELLERNIGQPVEHFAYPFGKANEASFREFKAVKALEFKTATTTRMANLFIAHKNYTESLPRISLNKATDAHVLNLQSSGLLPFIIHKGKQVITN